MALCKPKFCVNILRGFDSAYGCRISCACHHDVLMFLWKEATAARSRSK
jgi:hypothetical protein